MIARMEKLGVGVIGDIEDTPEQIFEQVKALTDSEAASTKKAKQIMELIEFEELRGDKEIDYWIRYNMRFGS